MRIVLAAVLLFGSAASATEPFGPFRTSRAPVTSDAREWKRPREVLPSANFYAFAFRVYQATISSQDGARCSHSPTCSLYGMQAVGRHGPVGFFLATDRLWRRDRSSALRPLPRSYVGLVPRLHDPLEAADFWLRGVEDHRAPEHRPPRPRQ